MAVKKKVTKKDSSKITKKNSKKTPEKIIFEKEEAEKKYSTNEDDIVLEVKMLDKDVCPPEYILNSDVGLDIRANETVSIKPLEQKIIKTGLKIRIPDNHVGLIRDRAGIVSRMNVHTAAGTFDPAYRGEISIILVNMGESEVEIEKGMRIAQMIIIPIKKVIVKAVNELSETERGDKGFGSTGISEKIKAFQEISDAMEKAGLINGD